jgi:cytochrome b pre-mRNA-processing protein 3
MFWKSDKSKHEKKSIEALYNALISRAREPAFYAKCEVPDTLDGRFELVIMHVFLLHKIAKEKGVDDNYLQKLIDWMFLDFDHNLREIGVSDLGVSHRIKAMGKAFLGRYQSYEKSLEAKDNTLKTSLARNLYGTMQPKDWQLEKMSQYMKSVQAEWQKLDTNQLLAGPFNEVSLENFFEN